MLLIADSGSTKTDWRFLEKGKAPIAIRTEGYNPYIIPAEKIEESLFRELVPSLNGKAPLAIHFYGAGCGTPEKKNVVASALRIVFPSAEIIIETDLLGAARALCGHEPGIAAILGTGSNSCSYDGETILENRPSLGYVLGDEGGGAALGKQLLRLFLYGDMEELLEKNFRNRFQLDRAQILDSIYRQPLPNRFLASFAKFIFQNIEHPQCAQLVIENFRSFFRHHINRYEQAKHWPLHVTGSVGFYFSNLLRRVAEEEGVRIGRITETPIAGMVNFYEEE